AVLLVNDESSIAQRVESVDRQIAAETERLQRLDEQFAELPEEAVNIRTTHAERRQTLVTMIDDLQRQRAVAAEGLMSVDEAGRRTIVDGLPVLSISRRLASQLLREQLGQSLEEVQQKIDTQVAPR